MSPFEEKVKNISCILNLSREIVGVKFIFEKEEFDENPSKQVYSKLSYCNAVKLATKGKSFKVDANNCFCKASARALGLLDVNNDIVSGRSNYSFRMYNSLGTAKNVQKHITYINHKIYGFAVMPLKEFNNKPDIVIMVVNPYQAMRIIQGYSYHFGVAKNIKITGNQGLCSECTATPYENNDLNISLLCSNTRFAAKWDDNEMGIGLPFHMFDNVMDGVVKTLNPSEADRRKLEIMAMAMQQNIDIDITLSTSYYKCKKGSN